MANPVTFDGITFPQGTVSFADAVELYNPAFSGGAEPTSDLDPVEGLGAPDLSGVTLGSGGRLIVEFTDNVLTGSGDSGADLHIFEFGPDVEDTFLDISPDGNTWLSVGKVEGSTSSVDIDPFLANSQFTNSTAFRFVRITDDINEGDNFGTFPGADIDAVGAIGSKFLTVGEDTDDTLSGSAESDNIVGGLGNDTVTGGNGNDILDLGGGDDTGRGDADDDILIGGTDGDQVYGNQNDDQVYGNQETDFVFGGLNQDLVFGGQDVDQVYGNQGDDQIYGNLGDDQLFGGQGNDDLFGGQGDDPIYGNLGDDRIYGNKGTDTLFGGDGSDEFAFLGGDKQDTVADFGDGDTIALQADINGTGAQSFADLDITQNDAGDAMIELGDDNSVTLQGVAASELSEADFSFF